MNLKTTAVINNKETMEVNIDLREVKGVGYLSEDTTLLLFKSGENMQIKEQYSIIENKWQIANKLH